MRYQGPISLGRFHLASHKILGTFGACFVGGLRNLGGWLVRVKDSI